MIALVIFDDKFKRTYMDLFCCRKIFEINSTLRNGVETCPKR